MIEKIFFILLGIHLMLHMYCAIMYSNLYDCGLINSTKMISLRRINEVYSKAKNSPLELKVKRLKFFYKISIVIRYLILVFFFFDLIINSI